jgi:transcriptional regulator with XRE-family HTH domain
VTDPDAYQRLFGETVRALREGQGLSQEELGRRSGLHRTYIGSVERGERNASLRAIAQLAEGLGLPAADLFARVDHSHPPRTVSGVHALAPAAAADSPSQ